MMAPPSPFVFRKRIALNLILLCPYAKCSREQLEKGQELGLLS